MRCTVKQFPRRFLGRQRPVNNPGANAIRDIGAHHLMEIGRDAPRPIEIRMNEHRAAS